MQHTEHGLKKAVVVWRDKKKYKDKCVKLKDFMTISKQLDVVAQPPAAGPSWGVSCRCSCLGWMARSPPLFLFLVAWRTRGLSGSLVCLFIYFKWPIPSGGLRQHGGPASCYYWPHTHMRIQTCNIRTVIVWRHASTQKDTCALCASDFLDKEHVYTWRKCALAEDTSSCWPVSLRRVF